MYLESPPKISRKVFHKIRVREINIHTRTVHIQYHQWCWHHQFPNFGYINKNIYIISKNKKKNSHNILFKEETWVNMQKFIILYKLTK